MFDDGGSDVVSNVESSIRVEEFDNSLMKNNG